MRRVAGQRIDIAALAVTPNRPMSHGKNPYVGGTLVKAGILDMAI
jgi:hypothetical protein